MFLEIGIFRDDTPTKLIFKTATTFVKTDIIYIVSFPHDLYFNFTSFYDIPAVIARQDLKKTIKRADVRLSLVLERFYTLSRVNNY